MIPSPKCQENAQNQPKPQEYHELPIGSGKLARCLNSDREGVDPNSISIKIAIKE